MGGAEVVRPIRCAHDAPRGLEHGMTFGPMSLLIKTWLNGREESTDSKTIRFWEIYDRGVSLESNGSNPRK